MVTCIVKMGWNQPMRPNKNSAAFLQAASSQCYHHNSLHTIRGVAIG